MEEASEGEYMGS